MKILLGLVIFGLIIYIVSKLLSKYEDNDKFRSCLGCAAIVVPILFTILFFLGTMKSCINDADNSPSYDYYDDARK